MHYKVSTPKAIEFRSKLGFKQPDIILTKEQSVVPKIMKTFSNENTLPQHSVLNYQTDLCSLEDILAIEVDEKLAWRQKYWLWNKRQKTIEKELGSEFIRINPDAENYIFIEIYKMHNHIIE